MSKNMFSGLGDNPRTSKKSNSKKKPDKKQEEKPEPKRATKNKKGSAENKITDEFEKSPEMLELAKESHIANLKKQPLKNEAQEFINERKKLELLKEAGDVMEFQIGDFLFFGYMEKCNNDMITMTKKLKPKIDNFVKERDTDGVIKLINREVKSILSSIKKNQKKDVKNWQKEHKT